MNAVEYLLAVGRDDQVAIEAGDERISYRELRDAVARAGAAWRARGLAPDERVLVFVPDSIGWVVAYLGAIWAGGVAVGLNSRLFERELGAILRESGARFAWCSPDGAPFLTRLAQGAPRPPEAIVDADFLAAANISSADAQRYPGVGFGLAFIRDCRNPENPKGFDQFKRQQLRHMRRREILAGVSQRIDLYARFFESSGYACPLPQHLKRTVNSGFPRYALYLDAHFLAEMCAGILVAVADDDRFEGDLTLDVAAAGEVCIGLGQRCFATQEGEIVLRDEKDIVCVLCQGADEKTRVHRGTALQQPCLPVFCVCP